MSDLNTNKQTKIKNIEVLYKKLYPTGSVLIKPLTPHGSAREYFLLKSKNNTYIGTTGTDTKENKVFIKMARHLKKQGVSVPEVLIHDSKYNKYIQTYCGDKDLFSYIKKEKKEKHFKTLCPAMDLLHDFQTKGTKGWNFKNSYPYEKFNKEEILRDSKRFTQRFLKHIPIEYSLKNFNKEINTITREIEQIPEEQYTLMHRDFQSRNILVHNKKYILIDFQGGRKGPIHYDIASLLYQSQTNYNEKTKVKLLEYFISKKTKIDRNLFMRHFYHIVLIRLIQTLGAYGIIGIEQQKPYFIKSIPFALKNMQNVLKTLKEKYDTELTEIEAITSKSIKYYDTRI